MNSRTAPEVTDSGMLAVGDGHEIFWEESGTRDGVPTLHLHGGPGGRLTPGYRRNSPAERARIIGLSQRGAGASRPHAGRPGPVDLAAGTTAHLVADLELLREHLDVEAWDALAGLAETRTGFDRRDRSPQRLRLVEAHRRMLTDADPALVDIAARAWTTWEDAHIGIGAAAPRSRAPDRRTVRSRRRSAASPAWSPTTGRTTASSPTGPCRGEPHPAADCWAGWGVSPRSPGC